MPSTPHATPTNRREPHDAPGRVLETHWTRLLYLDADATNEVSAAERIGCAAWTVARVVVALLAAYTVIYLAVSAVVYAATTPEIASAFVPDAASPSPTCGFPPLTAPRSRSS